MDPNRQVLADIAQIRCELRARGSPHRPLLESLNPARPLFDIFFDWATIMLSVAAVLVLGPWIGPVAVCVIANRQRALGNILHDAAHRNLCRNRRCNDFLALAVVAPLLFASLRAYRDTHFRHHMMLGDALRDPDRLPIPQRPPRRWVASFSRHALSWAIWLGSFAGHLASRDVPVSSKLFILAWWVTLLTLATVFAGTLFAAAFIALWLLARATVFHLITTFREMCDHFGLQPGGVFSFSRDMLCHGFWRECIHPRNNGYHLTHHLMPAVPYYRLPQAQRLFSSMPAYAARARVCRCYFEGPDAVIRDWQQEPGL